jgi:hypothetical protein
MKIKLVYLLLLGCLCILNTQALAVVVMTANDTNSATTSFNSDTQLHWSPAGAPAAGNTYSTNAFLLRTPTTAGNYTFAGDSLTVGRGAVPAGTAGYGDPFLTTGGVNNNSLINKTPTSPIITVNNLILDAGYIRDGMAQSDIWTLAGNIFVTANGGGLAAQSTFNINSAISGSGTLYIADNGNDSALRTIFINSGLNTYNGNIQLTPLTGNPAGRCRLTFAANSVMNFTIGASGVNNSISGTGISEFDGIFKFDLSGASSNIGDVWTVASATGKTFVDATFAVDGFTSLGGGLWDKAANGTTYQFSESTGALTVVPEPATIVMILTGAFGMGLIWLRKRK